MGWSALFLVPLPICFFLSFCVCECCFFFTFSYFCFFSSLFLLLLLLLLLLVFLLVLLVFVVILFSSYYYLLFFFLFIFFIFICLIVLFLFILLFFFLLINQKDRQKRQTGLIIDGKHSNILVFSCTSHEAKEKSSITQTLIHFSPKKTLKTWNCRAVIFHDFEAWYAFSLLMLPFLSSCCSSYFLFFLLSFFLHLWL